jgi:hypothetical protein
LWYIVKCLISQMVEVKSISGLEPAIKVVVLGSVSSWLSNSVLSWHIETPVELENNCDGVHITRHVNKVLKLVDICLNVVPALEVPLSLQSHQCSCHFVLWAEHWCKTLLWICSNVWRTSDHSSSPAWPHAQKRSLQVRIWSRRGPSGCTLGHMGSLTLWVTYRACRRWGMCDPALCCCQNCWGHTV